MSLQLSLEDLKKYLERIGAGLVRVEVKEVVMPSSGWYTVSFTQAFKEKPYVIALTEGYAPPISLPGLPKLSIPYIALPTWSRVDFTSRAEDLKRAFIEKAGDWGLLNWLRDRFADIFYWIGRAVGEILNWHWDTFIKPRVEMLNDFSIKLQNEVNKQLATIEGYFNNAMYRIQSFINTMSQHAFTIAPVRNITATSVDVYCPANARVRVIAIGRV